MPQGWLKQEEYIIFVYKLAYNLVVDLFLDSAITGLPLHYSYSFWH